MCNRTRNTKSDKAAAKKLASRQSARRAIEDRAMMKALGIE
ncbi:hypothetical protein NVP1111B_03 [Vibrio phage 1.111.B._10N.286.45.E6]|nr:hypothetical protein NVP1111A_03 [Vibrio phage 1.111.A._10N.286.45.E6]AUR88259.1 hypothetical protein NVP1111B_03 [Vibrio phage 1.111.B._10N.286.45.E6]